jgi:DnaJ-class molecular chaperone
MAKTEPCPDCGGKGKIIGRLSWRVQDCPKCGGSGQVKKGR